MEASPPTTAPAHWSKDFVEHLRTIHFALIVVSGGLIVLALSSQPYNTKAAYQQLEEIINLKTAWSAGWLRQNYKVDSIKTNPEPQTSYREPALTLETGKQVEKAAFLYQQENGTDSLNAGFPQGAVFSDQLTIAKSDGCRKCCSGYWGWTRVPDQSSFVPSVVESNCYTTHRLGCDSDCFRR